MRATAPRWSGPASGGGGAGRGGRPWRYTASGHWGGALGSITAVMMGLYISTSHHYITNAEVEKQVPGTHTLINYRTKTLTLLEIKTAGCGYLNNCHTRHTVYCTIQLNTATEPTFCCCAYFIVCIIITHQVILLPSLDKDKYIRSRQDSNLCGHDCCCARLTTLHSSAVLNAAVSNTASSALWCEVFNKN